MDGELILVAARIIAASAIFVHFSSHNSLPQRLGAASLSPLASDVAIIPDAVTDGSIVRLRRLSVAKAAL